MPDGAASDDEAARRALGWNDHFEAVWTAEGRPRPVGRAVRLDRGWSTVLTAPDAPPLRVRNLGEVVGVGDWVVVSDDGERVAEVLERWSVFARRASYTGAKGQVQVVAANVDTVLLVHALSHPPNGRRLERELVQAYESGADPVVVLSKADLSHAPDADVAAVEALALGVPVHAVSARTGAGVDALRAYARGGRTVGLLGASGVGKSTLVNAVVGAEVQRTAAVRAGDQRGRHTTTAAELVPLPTGGYLLDTPGLRAIALWSEGHGLERAFADVVALAERCRFRDCRHEDEPGCAVRAAVEAGELAPQRRTSWQRLAAELRALETELVEVERAERRTGRRRPRPRPMEGEEGEEGDEIEPGVDPVGLDDADE